jgi:hypothetical protein
MDFQPVYEAGLQAIEDRDALSKSKSAMAKKKSEASKRRFAAVLQEYVDWKIASEFGDRSGGEDRAGEFKVSDNY